MSTPKIQFDDDPQAILDYHWNWVPTNGSDLTATIADLIRAQ